MIIIQTMRSEKSTVARHHFQNNETSATATKVIAIWTMCSEIQL